MAVFVNAAIAAFIWQLYKRQSTAIIWPATQQILLSCEFTHMTNFVLPLRALQIAAFIVSTTVNVIAEDWPWFLGPRHDGTSTETDVNLAWPKDGPEILWKQEIGTGYSAPSILGDKLVVHHRDEKEEVVSCRAVSTGKQLWEHRYASDFEDPYGYNNGPRCSPVLHADRCYTLGADGILCCTDLGTGELIWDHDLKAKFDLPRWFFGVGSSPLLDGNRLIVFVGGQPNSGVVAFNTADGKVLWEAVGKKTWDGLTDTNSGKPFRWSDGEMVVSYASPIIATIHGKRHLLCFVRQGLVSLDPETGTQNFSYWFRSKIDDSVNAARPVVMEDKIFLSAAYRVGSAMLQVNSDGKSVKELWKKANNMLAHWSTPIHVDGYLYGFSGRHENEGELRCVRVEDGSVVWTTTGFEEDPSTLGRDPKTGRVVVKATMQPVPFPYYGRGSLIRVGGRFVVLGERGTLAVVHVNAEAFKEDCRTSFEEIRYPAWAAPVLSNGKLYLRSEDHLLCLDVRPK